MRTLAAFGIVIDNVEMLITKKRSAYRSVGYFIGTVIKRKQNM